MSKQIEKLENDKPGQEDVVKFLSDARREVEGLKLQLAKAPVGTLSAIQRDMAKMTAERDEAVLQVKTLTGERDVAVISLSTMKAERDGAVSNLTAAKMEFDKTVAQLKESKEKEITTRLVELGVSRTALTMPGGGNEAKLSVDERVAAMLGAKNHKV